MIRVHHNQRGRGFTHSAGLHQHVVRLRRRFDVQGIRVVQELDDYANHRLVVGERTSSWTPYEDVAKIQYDQGWIAGTTERWSGVLPRVFMYFT